MTISNRRILALSCAWMAIGLAGCGGGGSSGGGIASIPTPQPAPTATPTPAPTPTPAQATYAEFDNAAELATNAYGLSGDFTVSQAADGNYVITDFDYRQFDVGPGTNDYGFAQPSPGVLAMDIHGFGGSLFTLADGELFDQRGLEDEILQVSEQGVGIDLTYTRFGNYSWGTSGAGYISFLTLGVPTIVSDMPVSGSATYNGFVDGLWSDGDTTRRLFGSTATMSVDFGSGTLQTSLTLTGRDNAFGDFLNSPSTLLGTFTGSGTIASGSNAFSGLFNPQGGWTGSFGGTFNGPQATEYGYVFGLVNGIGGAASGSVVGRRN